MRTGKASQNFTKGTFPFISPSYYLLRTELRSFISSFYREESAIFRIVIFNDENTLKTGRPPSKPPKRGLEHLMDLKLIMLSIIDVDTCFIISRKFPFNCSSRLCNALSSVLQEKCDVFFVCVFCVIYTRY